MGGEQRFFRDQVDHTARLTLAVNHRGRPFEDLDALQAKGLGGIVAGVVVAQAVGVGIAVDLLEAAHHQGVVGGVVARHVGVHASGVAQGFGNGLRTLGLDPVTRYHRHGRRGFQQRAVGLAGAAGAGGQVTVHGAVGTVAAGIDAGRRQLQACALCRRLQAVLAFACGYGDQATALQHALKRLLRGVVTLQRVAGLALAERAVADDVDTGRTGQAVELLGQRARGQVVAARGFVGHHGGGSEQRQGQQQRAQGEREQGHGCSLWGQMKLGVHLLIRTSAAKPEHPRAKKCAFSAARCCTTKARSCAP